MEPREGRAADGVPEPVFSVVAVECSPERTVFSEDDNGGGWIATDTTVEVRR